MQCFYDVKVKNTYWLITPSLMNGFSEVALIAKLPSHDCTWYKKYS